MIDAQAARRRPNRCVVISDRDGRYQAYAWDRSTGELTMITHADTAVISTAISPDGNWIYAPVEHEPGTELGHIHRFAFDGSGGEDVTPDLDPFPIFGLKATPGGVIGIGAAGGSAALIVVDGADTRVLDLESLVVGLALSDDMRTAAVTSTIPGQGMTPRAQLIDLATGEVLHEHLNMEVGAIHGDMAAVATLEGDWLRPAIMSGEAIRPLSFDEPGDVRPVDWSEDGSTVLLLRTHRAKSSLYLHHVGRDETHPLLLPPGAIHPPDPSFAGAGVALAIWSDANHPRRVIEVGPDGWTTALELDDGEGFPGPIWEEFWYPSTEGARVQGWLLRPEGEGPWPTVLYTHGGPTSVALPSFNAICSAWFDAGFAVASINYRGSTTFGQSFREALTGRIGGPDVDDVVAAREWLVGQGIADSDRIVKNGYSYGGYLTLQSLGTHPDLWAAGVAGAPIADWVAGYDDTNDALKAYDMSIWGSRPDERAEAAARASPRTYAQDFRAPILITQPEADSRTPTAPVRSFVDDLRAHGKRVELMMLEGGHAGAGQEQTIQMVGAWLEFARAELEPGPMDR